MNEYLFSILAVLAFLPSGFYYILKEKKSFVIYFNSYFIFVFFAQFLNVILNAFSIQQQINRHTYKQTKNNKRNHNGVKTTKESINMNRKNTLKTY